MKKIPLTMGQVALVSDKDFPYLNQFKWTAYKGKCTFYAYRAWNKIGQKTMFMHRLIMKAPKNKEVDHRDGNGLNNCRSNLRLSTHAENRKNSRKSKNRKNMSSKFKGVCLNKIKNLFLASIYIDKKHKFIGLYKTEREAAIAYNKMAKKHFGKFASLNIIK
jgi:hypothetical protein